MGLSQAIYRVEIKDLQLFHNLLQEYIISNLNFVNYNEAREKYAVISELKKEQELLYLEGFDEAGDDMEIQIETLYGPAPIDAIWEGRKENHIHSWISRCCMSDSSQDINGAFLSFDLVDLFRDASKVNSQPSLASVTLPTTTGFFLGNEDYDQSYFNSIEFLTNVLEDEIKSNRIKNSEYFYWSSY